MTRQNGQVEKLLQQLPPHAIEAEMCVLGSALIDPTSLDDVVLILRGEDFYKPANGAIFDRMIPCREANDGKLDVVLLHQILIDHDILDSIGGQEYLIELASSVPSAHNAVHYARQVHDKAVLRRVIETAGSMLQSAYANPGDPRGVLDDAGAALFKLTQQSDQRPAVRADQTFDETMDSLDPAKHGARAIKTGFTDIDDLTSGVRKGEVMVIAARPSIGKSALALNMAMNIARAGQAVGLFSLEMSRHEISTRMLSSESGVSSHRMRQCRFLRAEDFSKLGAAAGRMTPTPLYIDDTSALTTTQLRAKARLLVSRSDVRVIFVDYLQLVRFDRRTESRRVEVGEISRAMKALARELDVPVVCMSQLNRASETRESHRPRMSDLRESGDLEQDADVVCLLHREEVHHEGDSAWVRSNPDKIGVAELIIAKQRNGPTGTVMLTWHGETMTFKSYSDAQLYAGAT